jgi:uncharacterized protein YdaU (DUF1376 family)
MTKKPDDWMPLRIGLYLADTTHLTRDQHGAYLLLLMAYWRRGGPLPADDARLAATTKATPAEWRKLKPVLAEFFNERDGFWHQKRADKELNVASSIIEARTEAGRAGGIAARGKSGRKPNDKTIANELQNNTPLPLPLPKEVTTKGDLNETKIDNAVSRVCEALGVKLTDDTKRLNWPGQIYEMISSGLVLEVDILPSCVEAKKRSIVNLQWVRKRAESEKSKRSVAASAPIPFENCCDLEWGERIKFYYAHPELETTPWRWPEKWGPIFTNPATKVPPNVLAEFKTMTNGGGDDAR